MTAFSEVLNESQLMRMFSIKQHAKELNWKCVEFVQSCVKDPIGIGKQININFFAPINEENDMTAAEEINFDFK